MDTVHNKLIVTIGLPGAGKTYVADVLGRTFGYYVYNGDTDIPERMNRMLHENGEITDDMRREFLHNMIGSVKKLSETHEKIVIHQAFIRQFMQHEFSEAFPGAIFLLVAADTKIRERRYMKRRYFNLGLRYLRHMSALFDRVDVNHEVIINNTDGPDNIRRQLQKIVHP